VLKFRKGDFIFMKKILMVVLDGYGWSDNPYGNAVKMAPPTHFLELWNKYPHAVLEASGEAVGLEADQFGNSEVGHTTIGAGRKILQSITLINQFLQNKPEENETFLRMLELAQSGKPLHIMGLLSDGKVHSSLDHYLQLIDVLQRNHITNVFFHIISDGRDTNTKALYTYISKLEEKMTATGVGRVASICGRYYAMDRDKNWERTKRYYDLVVRGEGLVASSIPMMIQKCYEKGITDEFLPPILTKQFVPIQSGDVLLWMNYRTDRAKQILSTFGQKNFAEFATIPMDDINLFSFLPVDLRIKTNHFLSREVINNPLGVYLSQLGLTQARIAETEKYAHVTYFFDGESNASLEKCNKYLIPSPKVTTYDLKPEMSAIEVTKKCVSCMEKDVDFIFLNFANPDMVGHTGNLEAAIKACITVDMCLHALYDSAEENFYKMVILADHGNADMMLDEKGNKVTTHTTSLVPFIITDTKVKLKEHGDLTNVAPTVLEYMDIVAPKEMKETESLIIK